MIQELLGGSSVGLIGGERSKFSPTTCGGILNVSSSPSLSPSPSPSPSSTSTPAVTTTAATGAGTTPPTSAENLRCPRCDSSNTKFCYYNNYNLTQPRHFCKTCRRYWTKGGALRNVPIGGGCRKNKSTAITSAVGKSVHAAGKIKTFPSDITKSAIFGGFEQPELPSNPVFWGSSQNSHLLSLLRANQNPNPTHLPDPGSLAVKEEGQLFGTSHFSSEPSVSTGGLNSRALGLDHMSSLHGPSFGTSNPLYRNQGQGIVLGEVQSNGLQELYQRLRVSSSTSCYPEHAQVILGNVASASASSASPILDSAPVSAADLGFWNPAFSWPADRSTANGAYP